jgi:hypothetical protein
MRKIPALWSSVNQRVGIFCASLCGERFHSKLVNIKAATYGMLYKKGNETIFAKNRFEKSQEVDYLRRWGYKEQSRGHRISSNHQG